MRLNFKGLFRNHPYLPLLLILLAALVLRLSVALPGILSDPLIRFSRPDTPGYLVPARQLALDGTPISAGRAPGFPLFAALIFRTFGSDAYSALALALIIISSITIISVYLAGCEAGSKLAGIIAGVLLTFNLTMIAQAPMFLSDTLAAFFIAWQFYFFVRFQKRQEYWSFPLMIALAALAALIRPINSVWIAPALVLLAMMPKVALRRKLAQGTLSLAIFCSILFPYMAYNARRGAGFCIDTNTGAMYFQNGAMLLAQVNGTSYESEKQKILLTLEQEFKDKERYPDEEAKVDYQLKRYKELILAHPFTWLVQNFQLRILLPDAPTFLEILNVTASDRGTMNVLQSQGVLAAVKFYFNDKLYILWLLSPLLTITGILYMGAFGLLIWYLYNFIVSAIKVIWLRKIDLTILPANSLQKSKINEAIVNRQNLKRYYYPILVFLAFAEYYFFLPGAITAPRYQLPALPLLALMSAFGLIKGYELLKEVKRRKFPNKLKTPESTDTLS